MVRTVAITLLRHGLTEDNQEKRFIGWSDSDLCVEGREQLHLFKSHSLEPDYIICSDLKRCAESREILFGHNQKIPIEYATNWRENNFGDWERKTHQELMGDVNYQSWLQDWKTTQIPNGEDYSTFSDRVLLGWQHATRLFLADTVNQIVIITHGGPIRKILSDYAPLKREFWEWEVVHGTGFTLETTTEHLRRNERCISLLEVPFKVNKNG
ncbi:histidine phosphatase family protein [Bacillus sp. DJP31]|uniref:histidine phosphatase family protein n=1 Tax=Bacillus sp. DJP31 TaxID=3409789 RepID=UPI003BB6CB97